MEEVQYEGYEPADEKFEHMMLQVALGGSLQDVLGGAGGDGWRLVQLTKTPTGDVQLWMCRRLVPKDGSAPRIQLA